MEQLGLFEAKPPPQIKTKREGPWHHWQIFTAHRYNGWIGWTWEGTEDTERQAKREARRIIRDDEYGYRKAWRIERIDFPA